MNISRSFKISDINWNLLKELNARLKSHNILIETINIELNWYPDTISIDSIDKTLELIKSRGNPKKYRITIYGSKNKKDITLSISRDRNIHGDEYLYCDVNGVDSDDELNSIMNYFDLEPDEPSTLPKDLPRTAFIAHRFDKDGEEMALKLSRFLELLSISVITGQAYSAESISSKVITRIEAQSLLFVILTKGEDNTWLIQESIIGKIKGKPVILIRDINYEYKPGIFSDHEYIPFEFPNIENSYLKILEGLRGLNFLNF